jgi:hypothetical protein
MLARLSNDSAGDHDRHAVEINPGRLLSLWNIMINFQVFGLAHILNSLRMEEMARAQLAGRPLPLAGEGAYASESDKARFRGLLKFSTRIGDQLELQGVQTASNCLARR